MLETSTELEESPEQCCERSLTAGLEFVSPATLSALFCTSAPDTNQATVWQQITTRFSHGGVERWKSP